MSARLLSEVPQETHIQRLAITLLQEQQVKRHLIHEAGLFALALQAAGNKTPKHVT